MLKKLKIKQMELNDLLIMHPLQGAKFDVLGRLVGTENGKMKIPCAEGNQRELKTEGANLHSYCCTEIEPRLSKPTTRGHLVREIFPKKL